MFHTVSSAENVNIGSFELMFIADDRLFTFTHLTYNACHYNDKTSYFGTMLVIMVSV